MPNEYAVQHVATSEVRGWPVGTVVVFDMHADAVQTSDHWEMVKLQAEQDAANWGDHIGNHFRTIEPLWWDHSVASYMSTDGHHNKRVILPAPPVIAALDAYKGT